MDWRNIYRGIAMGASDVIPGVSGGTIAVLFGIYDQFIAAINGIFSRDWKKHVGFLIPLAIGVATAILTLSRVMKWLLADFPGPTYFFFLGLIIGILPYLFHEAEAKIKFTMKHIILLIVGIILMSLLIFLDDTKGAVITDRTISTYGLLFLSGFLASAAMILPGISGSFVFLIIGVYPTVMNALGTFELDVIAVIGVGVFIGIIFMSKIINFFLKNYRLSTFAIIIGVVIGSVFIIFPGWPTNLSLLLVSIVAFAAGLFAAYLLGKMEYEG